MAQQEKQKVKLTISQVLEDLAQGLDRKQIREKYSLTATDVTNLFQHPKLKGKRVKPAPGFELEDDTAEEEKETPKKAASNKKAAAKEKVAETAAPVATASEELKEEAKVEEKEEEEKSSEATSEVASEEGDKVETKKGLW